MGQFCGCAQTFVPISGYCYIYGTSLVAVCLSRNVSEDVSQGHSRLPTCTEERPANVALVNPCVCSASAAAAGCRRLAVPEYIVSVST